MLIDWLLINVQLAVFQARNVSCHVCYWVLVKALTAQTHRAAQCVPVGGLPNRAEA
jgi:hypothetical protein